MIFCKNKPDMLNPEKNVTFQLIPVNVLFTFNFLFDLSGLSDTNVNRGPSQPNVLYIDQVVLNDVNKT